MKYPRLAPEDEKAFCRALDDIWNAVGYDCLVATAEEKRIGKKRTDYGTLYPAEQVTLPRSTVISITTDMFCSYGHNFTMEEAQWKRIREWMRTTPAHIVDKVARIAFPEKRFGA